MDNQNDIYVAPGVTVHKTIFVEGELTPEMQKLIYEHLENSQ